MLKEYLIRFKTKSTNEAGVAVVVASSLNRAQSILQSEGAFNGTGYTINYTAMINDAGPFNAEGLIEELYGIKGEQGPQGVQGQKGDKGDVGEPLTWDNMDPEDKVSLKEDIEETVKHDIIYNKYYPSMSVGMADNLVGRGDVQDARINFRESGGAGKNIKDGAARIKAIKGNSVVWNQLVNATFTSETKNGVHCVNNGDGSFSVWTDEGGATANTNFKLVLATNRFQGHTICISGAPSDSANNTHRLQISYYDRNILGNGWIGTASTTYNTDLIISIYAGTVISSPVIYRPKFIDLTQMFGEAIANEIATASDPIARYNELKPMNIEDEYAYNNGEIISVKVDALKSVGDNAYNPNAETPHARVLGGKPYHISLNNDPNITPEEVYFAEKLEELSDDSIMPNADGTYTFPSDGYVDAIFQGIGKDGDICVCLNHSYTKPFTYYEENTKDLSWIANIEYFNGNTAEYELLFPNGLRSAGSAYDEIRYNRTTKKWEAVKRIGEARVGDLSWSYTGTEGQQRFTSYSLQNKLVPAKDVGKVGNIKSDKYTTISHNAQFNNANDMGISVHPSGPIAIKHLAYTNANTFKSAMANAIIYYELANPIVVELDYPTEETNMDYLVWDFGTEEAIATETSAPFRADISYEFNAVDDIRWAYKKIMELEAKIKELHNLNTLNTNEINE